MLSQKYSKEEAEENQNEKMCPQTKTSSTSIGTATVPASLVHEELKIITPEDYFEPPEQALIATNKALLRALKTAGVQFVRYVTLDSSNNTRAKSVPLKRLLKSNTFNGQVSMAEVCYGGLPAYGDAMVDGTTVDARGVLIVKPDMSTLRVLPYCPKTAMVMGSVLEPRTNTISSLCTRGLLARVIATAARDHGIAFQVGAELEFRLVHDVGDLPAGTLPRSVDSSVFANTCTLTDQEEFISDLYEQLEDQDIEIELVHAESAPGQLEIVLTYQQDAMKLADNIVFAHETIRSVARTHKLRALFLPKIAPMQAGNGLHLHFSFRDLNSGRPKDNAFPETGKIGPVSPKGRSFIEGILQHLPPLLALTIPSVNSFRRVGKGCWTGHSVSWNIEDKESPLRVCLDLESGEATNVELKLSDSVANIYLELAAVLSAGLDGIRRNLDLRPSADEDEDSPMLPTSLPECLETLRKDTLLFSVLGERLVTNYVALRSAEVAVASKATIEEEVINAYNQA